MIRLTRFDQTNIILNSDLIQHVESGPDTAILLVTGEVYRVRESAEQVRRKVIEFRRESAPARLPALGRAGHATDIREVDIHGGNGEEE